MPLTIGATVTVPLFVALGASLESGADAATAIEGFWLGNSKRSIELR